MSGRNCSRPIVPSHMRLLRPELLEPRWPLTGQTQLVADLLPGADGSARGYAADFRGAAYFVADDGEHGSALWRSDGTAAGTWMVKDPIVEPEGNRTFGNLGNLGDKLYFTVEDGPYRAELWASDGSTAGSHQIFDLEALRRDGWEIDESQAVGEFAYFSFRRNISDQVVERALWRTDGTPVGTQFVMNLGPLAWRYEALAGATEQSLFVTRQSQGELVELWSLDTHGGLVQVGLTSGDSTYAASAGLIFFVDTFSETDSTLYVADASAGSQRPVRAIGGDYTFIFEMTPCPGGVLFSADSSVGEELWFSDGTTQGTRRLLTFDKYAIVNVLGDVADLSYFLVRNDRNDQWLWSTDLTSQGTRPVLDLWPVNSSMPHHYFGDGGFLYFLLPRSLDHYEIVRSDGTPAGTTRFIPTGLDRFDVWSSNIVPLSEGHMFLFANLDGLGLEPWLWQPLVGDANLDDRVDLTDFGMLKSSHGKTAGALAADFDFDQDVDLGDFAVLKNQFGARLPAPPLPAPTEDRWAGAIGLAFAQSAGHWWDDRRPGADEADEDEFLA